jgi:hypothetical protein
MPGSQFNLTGFRAFCYVGKIYGLGLAGLGALGQ